MTAAANGHLRRTKPFAQTPEALLYDHRVSSHAVRVWGCLDRHAKKSGVAFPSRTRIAALIGVSVATVKRALCELADLGWIRRVRRSSWANIWDTWLVEDPSEEVPGAAPATAPSMAAEASPGPASAQATDAPGWVTGDPPDGSRVTRLENERNLKETKSNPPSPPPAAPAGPSRPGSTPGREDPRQGPGTAPLKPESRNLDVGPQHPSQVAPAPRQRTPRPAPDVPAGTDGHPRHRHHTNAADRCARWIHDRKLPVDGPELLAWCYRAGSGDPWAGQRIVGEATEAQLDTALSPLRALRARLRDATTRTHAVSQPAPRVPAQGHTAPRSGCPTCAPHGGRGWLGETPDGRPRPCPCRVRRWQTHDATPPQGEVVSMWVGDLVGA